MTINCKGNLISFDRPKIMGILNITPDSFYDGGKHQSDWDILHQTEKMLSAGACFIDVGGQSSRPGATMLSAEAENQRVLPVIQLILKEFPDALISIDTFQAEVARASIAAGAALINDISAGNLDKEMLQTAAHLQVPYLMMHMRGEPKTMQTLTNYDDLITDILAYFSQKINQARALGINDLIIDPGFGFAKTIAQNFELLKKLNLFKNLELPILMGVSRKSTICKSLQITPEQALNGTTVLNTLALQNGANILRVHDVREARECIELVERFNA